MSVLKLQLQQIQIQDLGRRLAKKREATQRSRDEQSGGKIATSVILKALSDHMGTLDPEAFPTPEEYRATKRAFQQAFGIADSIGTNIEIELHRTEGRLAELADLDALYSGEFQALDAKVRALKEAEVRGDEWDGDPKDRPAGVAPGPSLADQLRAQDADNEPDTAEEGLEPAAEEPTEPAAKQETETKPKPKRRRRSSK